MWRWILVICSYLSEFGHHSVQVLGSFKHSDACISGGITCGKLIKKHCYTYQLKLSFLLDKNIVIYH